MAYIIAVTGKGGVGKTSVSGMLIRAMIKNSIRPILAVDADPNSCLGNVLGLEVKSTIGRIREDVREIASNNINAGISKNELLEMKIHESLIETKDFDLLAMGRSEGPGCYCYANNVLKNAIGRLASNYPYVVLDNEAGLENLSRRIVQEVNMMVMVSDPSYNGIATLKRLWELTSEMNIKYNKLVVIINRVRKEITGVEELGSEISADHTILLPDNEDILDAAERGNDIFSLSDNNPFFSLLEPVIKEIK